jgi:propanediol dehydratase large subunit
MEGKDTTFPVSSEGLKPVAAIVGGELIMLDGRKTKDLETIEEDEWDEEDSEDLEQNEAVVDLLMNNLSLINLLLDMTREKPEPPEK